MRFVFTSKIATHPLGHFLARQEPRWFDDRPFTMDPLRLNRVQPRALRRQEARDDAHPLAFLLDLPVVLANPAPHRPAEVPGGVIPHQQPDRDVLLFQLPTAPLQELGGHPAHRTTRDEAQPDLLWLGFSAQEQAVTGQRFGIRISGCDRLLDQVQGLVWLAPGMQGGLGESTPPGLILVAQRPVRVCLGQADQAVALAFFRRYPGSGLVIQRLARFHWMPKRSKVWRIVSPLTSRSVKPCWKLTAAAKSSVHRLVFKPKVRGLWCSRARRRSAASGVKVGYVVWGMGEPCCKASRPRSLKACRASSTVWSSQPSCWAMWGARSPRALAKSIWLRRITKASLERRPRSRAWHSSSVSGRIKMGRFIVCIVPHSRLPHMIKH